MIPFMHSNSIYLPTRPIVIITGILLLSSPDMLLLILFLFFLFSHYLSSRDSVFSFLPHLWVQQDGSLPSCSWFTHKLHQFLPHHFSGHSFRAGGATHLAAVGIPNERIQAMGHWTSEAWCSYVRKNPVILFAMLCLHLCLILSFNMFELLLSF